MGRIRPVRGTEAGGSELIRPAHPASSSAYRLMSVPSGCECPHADLELGIGVGVRAALDDRVVAVRAGLVGDGQLPGAREGRAGDKVNAWLPACRPWRRSRQIDAVAGLEADDGVAVRVRSGSELNVSLPAPPSTTLRCVAGGDRVGAGARDDVLDAPERVVAGAGAGGCPGIDPPLPRSAVMAA